MKKQISPFAFLLLAFAALSLTEVRASQTIWGGYCYFGGAYHGCDYNLMGIESGQILKAYVALEKDDQATCRAFEPAGMRISTWGCVKGTTSANVAMKVMDPANVEWSGSTSDTYVWMNAEDTPANVGIAVRFDYIDYTLRFASSQGGTMPPDIVTTYDEENVIPSPFSAPTGYHFVKWIATSSFDAEFSKDVSGGTSVNGEGFGLADCHEDGSVITLTALWAPNTYEVSSAGENCTVLVAASAAYDGELSVSWIPDGDWKKPTVTVYSGTDDKGSAIKTYSNLRDGTTSVMFKMSEGGDYHDKIFVRVSYEVYTLTFDPNGGTCGEKSRRVERGSLIGEMPKASQYQRMQEGWWDDPGAGNPITAAITYDWPGDVTAYAHWRDAELFNIDTIADPEEGGTLTGGGSYAKDEQITLTAEKNAGYSFVKWTAKTSGEEHTDPSWPITVVAGDLYTAFFTGNVYTVKFDCDEDLAERAQVNCPKSIKLTYGDPFSDLPAPTVGNPDYRFVCWMFDDGTEITPDTVFLMSGKINYIYAKVVLRPTYAIHYNGNGSTSDPMPNQKMYCGVADNLISNAYERIGYHFRGWATNTADAAARKIAYADGVLVMDIASTNETAKLYAVWDAITLGEAMHCNDPNLVWGLNKGVSGEATNAWTPSFGDGVGDGTDSCVCQTGGEYQVQMWLVAHVVTNGSLSFRWKPTGCDGPLNFWIGPENQYSSERISLSGTDGSWSTFSTNGIPADSWIHLYFRSKDGTCSIDQMTWTPDGPKPVDGKDNVNISSAAVSDGKFSLSFKFKEKFDYLLKTNANLLSDSWGIMEIEGTKTDNILTFEPEIIEGQPQLFYRVDTIQKK